MASEPALHWEILDESLLRDIYDSDQAMYPAPELSYTRLKSWVNACPELCLCLKSGHMGPDTHSGREADWIVHGSIIVLPLLQPFWDRLRRADISEHDVDAASMFPPCETSEVDGREEKLEVGLHVFHIERLPGFSAVSKNTRFTVLALEEIRGRVARTFASWNVVGYSALTATKEGNAAFKRLGFTSSDTKAGLGLLSGEAEMLERSGSGRFSGGLDLLKPFLTRQRCENGSDNANLAEQRGNLTK